jgi:hypothetical protein
VECCQVCGHAPLTNVLSLGYMPPVNQMVAVGEVPRQQPWFPTNLLHCAKCDLVQLGLAVDPAIIFPPEYPYTSGITKLLRDNFAELYAEASAMLKLAPQDLVIDIGSNDGTCSRTSSGATACWIEPTEVGGSPWRGIRRSRAISPGGGGRGQARARPRAVVTAANCFAHIEDVHAIVEGILEMLADDGAFISESHYLIPLLDTLQYDTVYHEHLRYYSLTSLKHLLEMRPGGLRGRFRPWRLDRHAARHGVRPVNRRRRDARRRAARRGDARALRASATT